MQRFSLRENILFSYKTCFHLLKKTFLANQHTQARFSPRRFSVMLIFSAMLLVLQTLQWLAYVADELFFPGYKSVNIRKPLFIMGVPRSGTTFLHRFLAADTDRFTTFTLWELIIAPTITQRKIIHGLSELDRLAGGPMKKMLQSLEWLAFGQLDAIHKISLSDPEEDYFALAPIYACFLMILPFPFPEDLGYLAFFDDAAPEKDKARIMAFYKTCLQRHLYVHGTDKILLSKNVSFGPMVQALARTFPDCRIVGTVRNPLFAVPSHISSMMEGAAIFDNDVQGNTFRDQMIDVQRYAYTHLPEVLPQLPVARHMIVRMEDIQTDLRKVVSTLYERFGYGISPAFDWYLRLESRKQKAYKSAHHYDLSSYGLSEEQIYRRFSDVFHRFGYVPPVEAGDQQAIKDVSEMGR
ncbi:MAG: sulfotransferase [Thermodesulfobacteriota bacterium]|nr:sulfotransferase [Thermodesulfobacteriota bacterium]